MNFTLLVNSSHCMAYMSPEYVCLTTSLPFTPSTFNNASPSLAHTHKHSVQTATTATRCPAPHALSLPWDCPQVSLNNCKNSASSTSAATIRHQNARIINTSNCSWCQCWCSAEEGGCRVGVLVGILLVLYSLGFWWGLSIEAQEMLQDCWGLPHPHPWFNMPTLPISPLHLQTLSPPFPICFLVLPTMSCSYGSSNY